MKTETFHTMEYHEFDKLVNDLFPKTDFNVVADEELTNDTTKNYGNITKDDFFQNDLEDFYKMILGKKTTLYRTRVFLEFLVAFDMLPEGNYLIDISW